MKNKFLLLSAFVLAMTACVDEKPLETPSEGLSQDLGFSLVTSSEELTKTLLGTDNVLLWKADDKLSVWEKSNSANSNKQFSLLSSTAGTSTGRFTADFTPASQTFELYSIYPYSNEYGTDLSAVSLMIPTTVDQSADVNGIIGVSDFMFGKASADSYDGDTGAYRMQFTHPLAFVKFVIDGSNSVFQQATIKSLTMTADKAFAGPVTVNLEDATVTSAATGDEGKTLVVNFPETAKMNAAQEAWVAINPVDLTEANCKFALEMTNGQKVTFSVNPKKMNGQALYEFHFTEIDAKIAAGKGATTPVRIDRKEDGTYAPANSYMIKEGGYYQFDARRVDKTNIFAGSAPYTDGYRAKWLWSTGTECILDEVGIGNTGRITVKVKPNVSGNAVIALLDPDGAIVWSWHIWCVAMDSPMAPYHYTRNDSWMMSDINLGATSKTPGDENAYGMYYQWGRKDPFPADKTKCVFNTGVQIKGVSTKDVVTSGSLAYTIANPTYVLYENAYRTWISADEAANAQTLWSSETNLNKKTNYDPCPPGYIVPVQNGYGWSTNFFTAANVKFNESGFIYTNAGVSTYYPAAGYLSGGTLTDAGKTARYWAANLTATPSATANMLGWSLLCTLSTSAIKTNEGSRTAFALPVRCMKQ